FFFSSTRRHTRFSRDWSSDVCSSDLPPSKTAASYLQEIPEVLEEAAVLDGGSPWQIFRYIIIPLSRPIMASVIILTAIMTWNEFLFGLILSVERVTPVTVGTTMYITSWTIKWGNIAAAMTLGVLPSLILCLTAQRLIVRGLTAGAVKG